jgi:hypothetical protein
MDRIKVLESAIRKNDAIMNEALKFIQAATGSSVPLGSLDRDILVCIVSELGQRYKTADVERLELKSLISNADSIRRYIYVYVYMYVYLYMNTCMYVGKFVCI